MNDPAESLSLQQSAEALCRRLRENWHAPQRLLAEQLIEEVPPAARRVVLRHLLVAEQQLRQESNESVSPEEYARRLPGDADLVAELFAAGSDTSSSALADEHTLGETIDSSLRCSAEASSRVDVLESSLSLPEFQKSVENSGLLSAAELSSVSGQQQGESCDLARALIEKKLLTRFQAEVLLSGSGFPLLLGDYVLLDRLGAGGMGEVFRARHLRMDRQVALKTLPAKMVDSPAAVARFHREVTAASKLSHPHIVTVYDAREFQGVYFYVMELVEGEDLGSYLKRQGPLPISLAVQYIGQAAQGLAYAHDQGVIHRDIKPNNILLAIDPGSRAAGRSGIRRARSFTIKILDLGLARFELSEQEEGEGLTGTGQVMGTADYMAPEQAADTRTADHRSDIYSLGCTLYRLLTGQTPFQGDTVVKKILAHIQQPVPSPQVLRPEVSDELDALCRKMMAKQPEDRPQSMGEVIAALADCLSPGDLALMETPTSSFAIGSGIGLENVAGGSAASLADETKEDSTNTRLAQIASAPSVAALERRRIGANRRGSRWMLGGFLLGLVALLSLAAFVAWLATPREPAGTLIVEGPYKEVTIAALHEDRERFEELAFDDQGRVTLKPGKYRIGLIKGGSKYRLEPMAIHLPDRGEATVRVVTRETPDRVPGSTEEPNQVVPTQEPVPPQNETEYELLANGWLIGKPTIFSTPVDPQSKDGVPKFSADGLMYVFDSTRPGGVGGYDLWTRTRAGLGDEFGEAVNLGPAVNTPLHQPNPTLTADGLTLLFQHHYAASGGDIDIWMSKREHRGDDFGNAAPLGQSINQGRNEGATASPSVFSGGLGLIFGSSRNGGQGDHDLWMASRKRRDEDFDEPVNLGPTVNSRRYDSCAFVTEDGLLLLFASNREGTLGDWDLWASERKTADALFGKPVHLGKRINSSERENGVSLSPDKKTLFFTTDDRKEVFQVPVILPSDSRYQELLKSNSQDVKAESATGLTARLLYTLPGGGSFVMDGKFLQVGRYLHDPETGEKLRDLLPVSETKKMAAGPAVSENGKVLAWITADGELTLWDAAAEKALWTQTVPIGETRVALDALGTKVSTGIEKRVTVWDIATKEKLTEFDAPNTIHALQFSESGKWLGYGTHIEAGLWNAVTKERSKISLQGWAQTFRFSHNEAYALIGIDRSDAKLPHQQLIWNVLQGRRQAVFDNRSAYVNAFLGQSNRILFAEGGNLQLWDLDSETAIRPIIRGIPINIISAAADGKTLAIQEWKSNTTHVWELLPYSPADRQAAEALGPYYPHFEIVAEGQRQDIPPGGKLPAAPFALIGIHFSGYDLPKGFANEIFLPAVEKLESLQSIRDLENKIGEAGGNVATILKRLADSPVAKSLKTAQIYLHSTTEVMESLKKFPQLRRVRFSFVSDDKEIAALQLLPATVKDAWFYRFGADGSSSDQGLATMAGLPLTHLTFEGDSPGVNKRLCELLAKSKTLRRLNLVERWSFKEAELETLAPLAASSSLVRVVAPKSFTEPGAAKLAGLLPNCGIEWNGKVIFHKHSPPAGETLDLLPLINPAVHARSGKWEMEEGALLSPNAKEMSLELPVQPAAAYRIEAEVERIEGEDSMGFLLVVGKHRVRAIFDALKSTASGLSNVRGQDFRTSSHPQTESVFAKDRPSKIVIEVTPTNILTTCNGKTIDQWQGSSEELSIDDQTMSNYRFSPGAISLFTYESRYRITKLTYTPLAEPAAD